MVQTKNTISVFEHDCLHLLKGEDKLSLEQLQSLRVFYKEEDFPYYSLIHNGVRFCEFVGVLHVGNLTIEILPKADRSTDKGHWRTMLFDMLRAVGIFNLHAPSSASLNLKTNSILDLYLQLFVEEVTGLVHRGLIKQYRKKEENVFALKGSIQFQKHLSLNIVHQERFYVRHTVYDCEHKLNQVLYKTLHLVNNINTNQALKSQIATLLLSFPEIPDVSVNDTWFERLQYSRKNEAYKPALDIARLLLLNYHPDIISGKNDVLALMFDMNELWERFIYISLQKYKPSGYQITPQSGKYFWKKQGGYAKRMYPDIVIKNNTGQTVVLDTKWKNIGSSNPSDQDLRQMYAYSKFHNNANVALVYPGEKSDFIPGFFYGEVDNHTQSNLRCGIMTLPVMDSVKEWQKEIAEQIFNSELFLNKPV